MKVSKLGAFGAMFLSLAGCATLTGGDLVRNNEPTGRLIVENMSGVGIDTLTLSRCSAMSYGLNRFGQGQQIAHGTSMSFNLGAGCWDLMVGRQGTCSVAANGASSCSWLQSPAKRFSLGAGDTQVVTYGPNG